MIKKIIGEILPIINKEKTKDELGDRTKYVGSSDVAKCPRQATLSRLKPIEHDLNTLIRFERGHLAENILSRIFERTKYNWTAQKELIHPEFQYLRSHVDFMFYTKNMKSIGICEVKTTSEIPEEPYDSWVSQIYWQMGLAKLIYPDANIRGVILALDLNTGDIREFDTYTPSDTIFNILIDKAHNIWAAINGEADPECEPSLLCGFCEFREDCPVFDRDNLPKDVWETVHLFAQLKEQENELKTKIEALKEGILKYIGGRKFSATNSELGLTLSVTAPRTSEFVDGKILKEKYPEIFDECKQVREYPASLRIYRKTPKGGE
jgi:predicted XRE-type DNA-binding protein